MIKSKTTKRNRAKRELSTNGRLSASAAEQAKALEGQTADTSLPSPPLDSQPPAGAGLPPIVRVPADGNPCNTLRELQAQRVAVVRSLLRLGNQAAAYCRRALGWRMDLPESDRAKICRKAAALAKAITTGKPAPEGCQQIAPLVAGFVLSTDAAGRPLEAFKANIEKQMRQLAEGLPAWQSLTAIRGFGELGLAIIIGEAGDLSNYANPGKLWKRLGLAPKPCYDDTTKDGDKCNKHPKRRRSAIWTIGDCLIKTNDGEYRQVYDARKAYEAERAPEMSKMHCHRRAQRYMEKRLVRNVWRAWKAAETK